MLDKIRLAATVMYPQFTDESRILPMLRQVSFVEYPEQTRAGVIIGRRIYLDDQISNELWMGYSAEEDVLIFWSKQFVKEMGE